MSCIRHVNSWKCHCRSRSVIRRASSQSFLAVPRHSTPAATSAARIAVVSKTMLIIIAEPVCSHSPSVMEPSKAPVAATTATDPSHLARARALLASLSYC